MRWVGRGRGLLQGEHEEKEDKEEKINFLQQQKGFQKKGNWMQILCWKEILINYIMQVGDVWKLKPMLRSESAQEKQ